LMLKMDRTALMQRWEDRTRGHPGALNEQIGARP
jgi:hypothetical protein